MARTPEESEPTQEESVQTSEERGGEAGESSRPLEEPTQSQEGSEPSGEDTQWYIFRGRQDSNADQQAMRKLPHPPPWRDFSRSRQHKAKKFVASVEEIKLVNAALYLRRPLLLTGPPGVGKSSLAYAVADELGLGDVLVWPISSRSQLKDGLYSYDAIGRLQASNMANLQNGKRGEPPPIGDFLRLGPLGTALADSRYQQPRVLLIDEIDKSDIDLPNDLLHVFEEGEFVIPELKRLSQTATEDLPIAIPLYKPRNDDSPQTIAIVQGLVQCADFPLVILTSNGERALPAPFLRRCLRLVIEPPNEAKLKNIVRAHFSAQYGTEQLPEDDVAKYIREVCDRREKDEYVATDQLLNAINLIIAHVPLASSLRPEDGAGKQLQDYILETISSSFTG